MTIAVGETIDPDDFIDSSAGAADEGKVAKLDAAGKLDKTFLGNSLTLLETLSFSGEGSKTTAASFAGYDFVVVRGRLTKDAGDSGSITIQGSGVTAGYYYRHSASVSPVTGAGNFRVCENAVGANASIHFEYELEVDAGVNERVGIHGNASLTDSSGSAGVLLHGFIIDIDEAALSSVTINLTGTGGWTGTVKIYGRNI